MPSSGSVEFSGCGISPNTVRASLNTPAMQRAEPLTLSASVSSPVGVAIAEGDAALALEPVECCVVGGVIAFAMRDRHADRLTRLIAAGEDRLRILDAQMDVAADEAERLVVQERAGQHAGLGQHLEAVADAQHRYALGGARLDLAHDRRVRRHRAATQVVAIGEAAGQHDQIGRRKLGVAMPDDRRLLAAGALQRGADVVLAIGAGEDDDGSFHKVRVCQRDCQPSPQPSPVTTGEGEPQSGWEGAGTVLWAP